MNARFEKLVGKRFSFIPSPARRSAQGRRHRSTVPQLGESATSRTGAACQSHQRRRVRWCVDAIVPPAPVTVHSPVTLDRNRRARDQGAYREPNMMGPVVSVLVFVDASSGGIRDDVLLSAPSSISNS